jgi:murein DD-endopeptidase MepM/ murein hydrolase activator NlpD
MISKKLVCTIAFLAILATSLLAPSYAAAEGDITPFSGTPAYISELRNFLAAFRLEVMEEVEEKIHVVARGETLRGIARLYDMEVEELVALNEITDPDLILVDQELKVSYPAEIQHTLVRGETLAALALMYGVELEDILQVNEVDNFYAMPVGMVITIPNPQKIPPPAPVVTVAARSGSTVLSSGSRIASAPAFSWPLRGTITSRYGVLRSSGYHLGLDIAAPTGTPIKAAAAGVVTCAARLGGYGLMVTIDHGGGWSTLYGHASSLLVTQGQEVARGQEIARVGMTGNATGPHVHFEVIYNGKKLNPQTYLPR